MGLTRCATCGHDKAEHTLYGSWCRGVTRNLQCLCMNFRAPVVPALEDTEAPA